MEYQLKVNFSAGNNYVDVTSGDASQAASGMPLYINNAPFYVQSLSGSRIHLTAPLAYSQTGADALLQTEHINGRALLAGGEVSPQIAVNAINAGLAALEQVALRDGDFASDAEMAAGVAGKVPDAAKVKDWVKGFGVGDVRVLVSVDLDSIDYEIRAHCSNCSNRPDGAGNGWLRSLNLSGNNDFAWQEYMSNGSIDYGKWIRQKESGVWKPWQEVYHSGNSVNPLGYGFGTQATRSINEAFGVLDFNAAVVGGIYHAGGNEANGLGTAFGILQVLNYVTGFVQQVFYRGSNEGEVGRVHRRWLRNGVWSEWIEDYSEANLNVNEFTVLANDVLGAGYRNTFSEAIINLPLNAYGLPVSASVSGTVKIINVTNNATIATGATLLLSGRTSERNAQFFVPSITGADPKDVLEFVAETSIKITVNY